MDSYEELPDTDHSPRALIHALMTIEEAAELLCTTPRHVERLVEERQIGHCKVGRFTRLTVADIEAYLDWRHVDGGGPS